MIGESFFGEPKMVKSTLFLRVFDLKTPSGWFKKRLVKLLKMSFQYLFFCPIMMHYFHRCRHYTVLNHISKVFAALNLFYSSFTQVFMAEFSILLFII